MSYIASLPGVEKSDEEPIGPVFTHTSKKDAPGSDSDTNVTVNGTRIADPRPLIFSPTVGSNLGSPTALAIGAFATTLTTLSFSLMEWRGVTTTNVYIGNFFFVAGIGMVITAQWELVKGNSFGYTVLSAFGFFYGGFGAIITPLFGVAKSYGTDTPEYYNALGFFVIMWTVFNTFFLIASLTINLVYIGIFFTVEMAFLFVAAAYFALADGHVAAGTALKKAGGVFAFLSGLLGWYTVGHLMCQEALFFSFPMGDTTHFYKRFGRNLNMERPAPPKTPGDRGEGNEGF